MAYIGNGAPPELLPENVRDDLIPNPGINKVTFDLSQEVPGGYEGNVVVYRRKFAYDDIVVDSADLTFTAGTNRISTSDGTLANLLSRIQVGDKIVISGAVDSANNGIFPVTAVAFIPGTSIEFTVNHTLVNESGGLITVKGGEDGPWETLEPEVDYTIGGVFPFYNRQITLSEVLQEEDVCYVYHRASATFNLVPSPNSVGPDQLSLNLRNFACDRFEGDNSEDEFQLSTEPINSRAIQVTVDGVLSDGDDVMQAFVGEWELDGDILRFHTPPGLGAAIRVLHLGFSTVSRRAALSEGQVGVIPPASVTALEIANLAITTSKLNDLAVTTLKIAANAVTGAKILLANEEALRATKFGGGNQGLLRLNASDHTVLMGLTQASVEIAGTNKVNFTATTIEPQTTNDISLGTVTKKFKDLNLSGNAEIDGNITIHGNIILDGNIDNSDISDLQDQADDNTAAIADIYASLVPVGTLVMTARATAPTRYMLCQGQAISRATYAALFAAIGTAYGPGDGSTTFNIPDLRQRFALGKTDAGAQPASNLAATGGSINHTHSFAHTHNLTASATLPDHLHSIGTIAGNFAHNHTAGTHTHPMSHTHKMTGHFHYINPGYGGESTFATITENNNGSHDHAISINSTTNNIADGGGSRGIIRQAGPSYISQLGGINIFSYNLGGHTHTPTISGRVGRRNLIDSNNGDDGNLDTGASSTASTSASSGTTGAVNGSSAVSMSGNSGNPTSSPAINSSGSTTSQSTSTTDAQNPPYIVVNYMIKVE